MHNWEITYHLLFQSNTHNIIRATFTAQIPIHVLELWHSYDLEREKHHPLC